MDVQFFIFTQKTKPNKLFFGKIEKDLVRPSEKQTTCSLEGPI
jgi:hypothetical protein